MSEKGNRTLSDSNGKMLLILAIVWLPLIFAFWSHVAWSYVIAKDFFSLTSDVSTDSLKKVFTALMWLIMCIITLFTPTKALKSPLAYLAEQIASKWENLKNVKNEPDAKKNAYLEIIINIIYLTVMTASYYFIVKNIVQYDSNYAMMSNSWVLTVLLFGVVVAVFLAFTSFIIWKLQEIDDSSSTVEEEKRQQQKTLWSIWLIIWVLVSLWVGNSLLWTIDDYFKNQKDWVMKSIYENLWGSKENLWDWETIDLFDKK